MYGCARRGVANSRLHLRIGRFNAPRLSRRGISLIETLVAFAIVAVALALLGELTFWATSTTVFSKRYSQAALLAQERMEDLLAHRGDLRGWEEQTRKDFATDDKFVPNMTLYTFDTAEDQHPELRTSFRWNWQIKDVPDHPKLKEVQIQLFWRRQGVTVSARHALTTLLEVAQ